MPLKQSHLTIICCFQGRASQVLESSHVTLEQLTKVTNLVDCCQDSSAELVYQQPGGLRSGSLLRHYLPNLFFFLSPSLRSLTGHGSIIIHTAAEQMTGHWSSLVGGGVGLDFRLLLFVLWWIRPVTFLSRRRYEIESAGVFLCRPERGPGAPAREVEYRQVWTSWLAAAAVVWTTGLARPTFDHRSAVRGSQVTH